VTTPNKTHTPKQNETEIFEDIRAVQTRPRNVENQTGDKEPEK